MIAMKVRELCEIISGELLCGDLDAVITGTSVTSKEGDAATLFVPTIGERVDAHDYIADAYQTGMRVTLSSRKKIIEKYSDLVSKEKGALTVIYVQDTLAALQTLAKTYRGRYMIPLIGITGSVGKTTTKEMVAAALGTQRKILKTAGNKNSQIGLAQMMLALDESYELAVIEMGISLEKEMEKLASIARPECALITNIGVSHIGQMGSKANIVREKLDIISQMKQGILFVCGDDPMLWQLKTNPAVVSMNDKAKKAMQSMRVLTFGLESKNDFYARDISQTNEGTAFTFCIGEGAVKEMPNLPDTKELTIHLSVLGNHNVKNAVAALCLAIQYDVALQAAADGLAAYRPISMRGGIEKLNNLTMIDDTYNASPDSMKSSLDVLDRYETAGRKIAVLGDILELGEVSEECHREVGSYAAHKDIDLLITVGKEAEFIAKAFEEQKRKENTVIVCRTNEEVKEKLSASLKPDDLILLKASRGMQLETVSRWIRESSNE